LGELGLVYACQKDYARMVEALRRAVGVGAGGVRAYLGERPLGDVAPAPAADAHRNVPETGMGEGEDAPSLVALTISHLAAGRYGEAAGVLGPMLGWQPECPPAAVALLALTYLLRGEEGEVIGDGIRHGTVPVDARGEGD
jgi:hypothetical protein